MGFTSTSSNRPHSSFKRNITLNCISNGCQSALEADTSILASNVKVSRLTLLFPVEVLDSITKLLDSDDCTRLFLIGNCDLTYLLQHGGITSIYHKSARKKCKMWPELLLSRIGSHLRSLQIYRFEKTWNAHEVDFLRSHSPNVIHSGENHTFGILGAAGASLQSLDIKTTGEWNTLLWTLFDNPCADEEQFVSEDEERVWRLFKTDSKRKKQTSNGGRVYGQSLMKLFPNLVSVRLQPSWREAYQLGHMFFCRDLQFPSCITKISIPLPCYHISHFQYIPTLVHLETLDISSNYPSHRCEYCMENRATTQLQWNSLFSPLQYLSKFTLGCIYINESSIIPIVGGLPDSVTDLTVLVRSFSRHTIRALPPNLIKLHVKTNVACKNCFQPPTEANIGFGYVEPLYPAEMTHIIIEIQRSHDSESLIEFVPEWIQIVPKKAIEFVVRWPFPAHRSHTLSIYELDQSQICSLPPTLRRLEFLQRLVWHISTPSFYGPRVGEWWTLLHNICELSIGSIDAGLLATMTQLETLHIDVSITNLEPYHWLGLARLKTLTLGLPRYDLYLTNTLEDAMVAALPRSLENLACSDLTGCALPQYLRRLYLYDAKDFEVSNLTKAPHTLHCLEVLDLRYNHLKTMNTSEFCLLPSSLRSLRVAGLTVTSRKNFMNLPINLKEFFVYANRPDSASRLHIPWPPESAKSRVLGFRKSIALPKSVVHGASSVPGLKFDVPKPQPGLYPATSNWNPCFEFDWRELVERELEQELANPCGKPWYDTELGTPEKRAALDVRRRRS